MATRSSSCARGVLGEHRRRRDDRLRRDQGGRRGHAPGGRRLPLEALRAGRAADRLHALPREARHGAPGRVPDHRHLAGADLFFGESLAGVRGKLDLILATERRLEKGLPPILIEGETGTGKSLLAGWLHRQGPRGSRPFIKVNCAALPETLAESELFGHERGAFTDAKTARIGLFEAADGGTLFLDDIGTLSPSIQAKVLTAVEDHCIRRLGATKEIRIDVRLIAASNEPLADLAASGEFREDLYHRLHLLHIALPPLRERGLDIYSLGKHMLERIAKRHRIRDLSISPAGKARLLAQRWPGNARELAHAIEREVIFARGPHLDFESLGAAPAARRDGLAQPDLARPGRGLLDRRRDHRPGRRGASETRTTTSPPPPGASGSPASSCATA
jgi:DNA-binding NtrC family response regulator